LLIKSICWINIKIFFSTSIITWKFSPGIDFLLVGRFVHFLPVSGVSCPYACLYCPTSCYRRIRLRMSHRQISLRSKVAPLFAPKPYLSSLLHQRTLIHRPFVKSYIQCRYSLSEKKKRKTRNPKLYTSLQS